MLLGESYDERSDVYSFSIIMWQLLFEETTIFCSSYSQDPKFRMFMTQEMLEQFSKIKMESCMGVPKLILDGIRPPTPTLPLRMENTKHVEWVQQFIKPHDQLFSSGNRDLDTNMRVLDGLFALNEQCWHREMELRPSFTFILEELKRLLNLLGEHV